MHRYTVPTLYGFYHLYGHLSTCMSLSMPGWRSLQGAFLCMLRSRDTLFAKAHFLFLLQLETMTQAICLCVTGAGILPVLKLLAGIDTYGSRL